MNLPKIVGTLACKYANKVEESYQDSNAEVVMLLTDFARELLSAPPEVVPKFALDSQIEITNQERASKEHAEGVIRSLLDDRDRIIEQCATVCDEHARTYMKLSYHHAAAQFLARRIRELAASSPQRTTEKS